MWTGVLIGIQIVLWTVSGLAMALLDMEEVAGGERAEAAQPPLPADGAWPAIREALGPATVTALTVRPLLDRQVIEVTTPVGVRLFDAGTGTRLTLDAPMAGAVAAAGHPGKARIERIERLEELTLAVRKHKLPIWRVDFADEAESSFYVSGETGKLLERRNSSWRTWDFFWMLHNMDYAKRESFNHPLIVFAAVAALWLAITGVWLLFRTVWRPDLRAFGRPFRRS
jgi:hypothetical protein